MTLNSGMTDLTTLRGSVADMCADVIAATGVAFAETTELQRQVLACFAFGMTFAAGRTARLTPPEVHALAIAMLIDVFKYSDQQAPAFAHTLIESVQGGGNPTIRAIVHRGIDGHLQWRSGNTAQLGASIGALWHALSRAPGCDA